MFKFIAFVGLLAIARISTADVMVIDAPFGEPNEAYANAANNIQDESYVDGYTGPAKFDPAWRTLTGVTLQLIGDTDSFVIEGDTSSTIGDGYGSVDIGFGDFNVGGQAFYDGGEGEAITIDSGPMTMDPNDFVGTGDYLVYHYCYVQVEGSDTPGSSPDVSLSGVFRGHVIVTYTYTPN